MKKIDIENITNWNIAKKTKPIKAKPLVSIMVDKSVLSKFLIDTLEGKEFIGDGAICCIGESNDIWQQMPSKLLQKYDVVAIDDAGWMVCEPKPDNSVECVEIKMDMFGPTDGINRWVTVDDINIPDLYYIEAGWGEINLFPGENVEKTIQKCSYGDFICRNREDKNDVWIVRKKIFLNTYNIIS